jgi:ParB/RepB/Spo0J family partition protein
MSTSGETKAVETKTELMFLDLFEQVTIGKTNPRKRFKPEELAQLQASIAEKGLVTPITVRPIGEGDKLHYELVVGERRFRALTGPILVKDLPADSIAALAAQGQRCPCFLRELTDQQALELQIIENLQRDDLDALEEAEGYEQLMLVGDMDARAIAGKINKEVSYVYRRLKLLNLPKAGRGPLLEGVLGESQAMEICCLPHADQREETLKMVLNPKGCKVPEIAREFYDKEKDEPMTYKETVWLISNFYQRSLNGAVFSTKDETLNPKMGPCHSCPRKAGNSPEIFPGLRADMCTDVKCFMGKQQTHCDRLVAGAKAKGQKVLTDAELKKTFVRYGGGEIHLKSESPYVELDGNPGHGETNEYSSKRKWRDLVKGRAVPVVIAVDENGKVHELVDHKLAATAAKENKPELFAKRSSSAGSASDKAEAAKRKQQQAVTKLVFAAQRAAIVAKVEKMEKLEAFADVFLQYALKETCPFENWNGNQVQDYAKVLRYRGIEFAGKEKAAMEAHVKTLTTSAQRLALAVDLLLVSSEESYGPSQHLLNTFAGAFKLDRKKMEESAKATIAEQAAAAKAKKPAPPTVAKSSTKKSVVESAKKGGVKKSHS